MQYKNINRTSFLRFILNCLTMPIIWAPLPFLAILDIMMEIYHRVCFPVYGIEYVKRSEYIQVLDRSKLQYLHVFEKLGCMYCGYVNGCLLYMKEIAGRTEYYWCGIMHANKSGFKPQPNQDKFARYNDEDDFDDKFNGYNWLI
jgi:hypothetical protein